jgi:hypothetical protein
MIAEKDGPLGIRRRCRSVPQNVDDRKPFLLLYGHEQPRHQGKIEAHMTFVVVTEIRRRFLGPLIGFRQEKTTGEFLIDASAKLFEERMRFRQTFAIGPFALVEIGNGIEP